MAELDPAHLHRPEEEWPLLLAGPILRRVTATSVAVFVAVRDECNVELHIHDNASPTSTVVASTTNADDPPRVVKLGRKLFVSVMEVEGQFVPGHEYGYDISIFVGGHEDRLGDLSTSDGDDGVGLLAGPVPLGYVANLLPTLMVPVDRDSLRLVQASCRKPHGGDYEPVSDPDALPIVDRLFQEHRAITDPAERIAARPHQLLLTGDQIYADDVPATMLAATTALSAKLLGWGTPETWPNSTGGVAFGPDDPAVAPGERSFFLESQAVKIRGAAADTGRRRTEAIEAIDALDPDDRVTGGAWEDWAANHLLFFGEFCAMYLLAWSPTLWQTRDNYDPQDRIVDPNSSVYYLQKATDAWVHSGDTTTPALLFAEGLPFVRRAMANIATYMMFDDHDVTDDWFLNKAVHDRLRFGDPHPSSGGRRLMRNALCAYAVFQHWGNDPAAFSSGYGQTLLDAVDVSTSVDGVTPTIGQPGDETTLDTILDVGVAPAPHIAEAPRMRWDYLIEFPSHRLLALDTRTWREFPGTVSQLGTDAIADAAADRIEQTISWGLDELRQLITGLSALTIPIVDAGAQLYQDIFDALADLMNAGADVADALRSAAGNAAALVIAAVNAARAYVDKLIGTTAVTDFAWAAGALASADAELDKWVAGSDAVDDAMTSAMAMNAAVLVLRANTPRIVATFAVDLATSVEEVVAASLWATADFLDAVADYIRAAGVSHAQAARDSVRLSHAWISLVGAPSITLHNLGAAATAAVNSALGSAANAQAALQAAVDAYTQYVDPVVDLLVGSGAEALNAGLISDGALDFQVRDRLAADDADTPFTVILSPAPLFGHWLVEVAQKMQLLLSGDAELFENEPWSGNVRAYHRTLRALAPLGSAVVLSGDVHYAYSTVNDFSAPGGLDARFVQLTSSAAKNAMSITMCLARIDEFDDDDLIANVKQFPFEFVKVLPALSDDVLTMHQVEALLSSVLMEALQEVEEFADLLADPHWGWNLTTNLEEAKDAVEWAKGWAYWLYEYMTSGTWEMLYSVPLRYHTALMLLHDFGLDPGHFDQIDSTVLHDRRSLSRLHDSPGLDARISAELPALRNLITHSQRRTVGSCNIGVITFESAPIAKVTHELHYFPRPLYEASADLWLSDGPATEFRPDWIVTRHVAGLEFGTTPDVGLDDPLEPGP